MVNKKSRKRGGKEKENEGKKMKKKVKREKRS